MKIFITGNAGSGKSTLGKKLAAELDLPFYTLDKIVWQAGWKKTPEDQKKALISQLTSQDLWVIDGVSDDIHDKADIIIFLDVPRRVSLWRAYKRSSRYLFSSRPDLPPNCPEILILPLLTKVIWRFPRTRKPKILAYRHIRKDGTFIHITKKPDIDHLLSLIHACNPLDHHSR